MQPPDQPLPWADLQDFLAVARAGRMARAAAALGVDATTVGRRLRRLQARLGQILFEQTRHGQALTEQGERLLRHVEMMERAADRIDEARHATRGLSGVLRVSMPEGFGTALVAPDLHAFAAEHPDLTVELALASGLNPSRREADLAVVLARPRAGPVVSGKLCDYRLCLYASHGYLARHRAPGSVADLVREHRLIGYMPDLLPAPELDYLGEIDPRLVAHLRSSSINAQHRLVATGAGLGVLPRFIGDADPGLHRVLPEVAITRSFWIVTHRDTRQLQRVRTFRAWLVALAQRSRPRLLGAD